MQCDSFISFFNKIGRTFKLLKELLKTQMNHDEINADTRKVKKDERL